MRRELIANISHDLRTPLAIIQGYVETLQMKSGHLPEKEQAQYLETIANGSQKLSKLIAQLFEYSKLEAKQIVPTNEAFALTELVQDVHQSYKGLAQKKKIQLQLEMAEELPLVFGDISLVERAIQNLMDNALKFTPDGGSVTVILSLRNNAIEISIRDSGPGIREAEQTLIFERYRQAKTGNKKEGSGLGLAIVRKIVELHHSSIRVISSPNKGATFSFSLPVYKAPEPIVMMA